MKSAIITVVALGCSPSEPESQFPAPRTPPSKAALHPNIEPASEAMPVDSGVRQPITTEDTLFTCAVRSWPGESGPETFRITLTDRGGSPEVFVRHALTREPDSVLSEAVYRDATLERQPQSLDAMFGDSSIHLWQHEGHEGFWQGFLFGLADHSVQSDGPPPPCGGVEITCWEPNLAAAFAYDSESGLCLNDEGQEGLNPRDGIILRERGTAECGDLRWLEPSEGIESPLEVSGWDLRGADLRHANLDLTHLTDAHLEGAQLDEMDLGTGSLMGTIDSATALPPAVCVSEANEVYCAN